MLWRLTYRKPMGVETTLIEAPDAIKAEETGRFFCSNQAGPGYRYINVVKAISFSYPEMLAAQGREIETVKAQLVELAAKAIVREASSTAEETKADGDAPSSEAATLAALAGSGRTGKAKEPKPTAAGIAPGRIGQ